VGYSLSLDSAPLGSPRAEAEVTVGRDVVSEGGAALAEVTAESRGSRGTVIPAEGLLTRI